MEVTPLSSPGGAQIRVRAIEAIQQRVARTQPEIHNASGGCATSNSDVPGQTHDRCFSNGDRGLLRRETPYHRDVFNRQNRPSEAHRSSGKPRDQHIPEDFKSGLTC
jgi:hypothetical protein